LGEMPDLSERALCQPILKEVVAVLSSVQSREASANWMGEVQSMMADPKAVDKLQKIMQ